MDHHAGGQKEHRIGHWLPHQDALEDWLEGLVKDVRARRGGGKLHPAVEEFRELIEGDPVARLLMTQMIEQVPGTKPYTRRHLEGVDQMLTLIDEVIGRAPEYNETGHVGMVEVSSCVIHPEVRQGHRVKKGDEVGYFQYGGSTYCLIFRPGAVAGFAPEALPQPDNPDPPVVLLGAKIATADSR